jgi:hypothetical protein
MDHSAVATLAEKTIGQYIRDHHAKDIGGPIQIVWLTVAGATWLHGVPDHNWTYLHDFIADYRSGKVPVHLYPGVKKNELDALMADADAWSRSGLHH